MAYKGRVSGGRRVSVKWILPLFSICLAIDKRTDPARFSPISCCIPEETIPLVAALVTTIPADRRPPLVHCYGGVKDLSVTALTLLLIQKEAA